MFKTIFSTSPNLITFYNNITIDLDNEHESNQVNLTYGNKVTEALNMPQKHQNMMLSGKFSQPYS